MPKRLASTISRVTPGYDSCQDISYVEELILNGYKASIREPLTYLEAVQFRGSYYDLALRTLGCSASAGVMNVLYLSREEVVAGE